MHMLQNSVACIVYNRCIREEPCYEKNFLGAIALNLLYFYKRVFRANLPETEII